MNRMLRRIFALLLACILLAGAASAGAGVEIDYRAVSAFSSEEEYASYLKQLLSGLGGQVSESIRAELSTYVETAVSALSSISMDASLNRLTVTGEDIGSALAEAEGIRNRLQNILLEGGVTFNKPIGVCLRISGEGFSLDRPGEVTFSSGAAGEMGPEASISVLLGDNRHSVSISADSLREISAQCGDLTVRFQQNGFRKYAVYLMDGEGNGIDKLPSPISLALPANSELATVLATYQGGVDNWGGQYDASNGAIGFSTRFSAEYEVLENAVRISDTGDLPDEARSAIEFMVSKGCFTLSGDRFEPNRSLTKYDFTAALVKMFFALDRQAKTGFPDVPADSVYYAYVASAEAEGIARGDENGNFSGDKSITVQEVVALCARTLAEKKAYTYPEDADEYLNFTDAGEIGGWAKQDVALAVREGLIGGETKLNPAGEMSRAESALILYRLFMLLYETSPIAFELGSGPAAEGPAETDALAEEAAPEDGGGFELRDVMDIFLKLVVVAAAVFLVVCVYLLFFSKGKKRW
ncbi:MAG: S-layer homology domain-containing protein [Oscillospiraceae bacterium]|jgi:hypothetical protein